MYTNYPPDKLKSLRIRSLLTVREVKELTGISNPTIINSENGHHKMQKRLLDKLLTLYAIRIARLEGFEKIWSGEKDVQSKKNESPRSFQQDGVVERNGSARGPYKAKQSPKHAR